jgi:cold shock protein
MSSEAWSFGTLKWFRFMDGYGFVVPDGGGEDVMIHASKFLGERGRQAYRESGARVAYVPINTMDGRVAAKKWNWADAKAARHGC